jgi:vacuolar-type H+-ATPase subunit I/STV1
VSSDEEENEPDKLAEPDEPKTNEEVNLNEPEINEEESEVNEEVNLNEPDEPDEPEEVPEPLTNQEVKNNITKTQKLLEEYKEKPTKELNEKLEKQIALTQNMAKELYKANKTPETQELVVKTSAPTTKKIEKPGQDWEKCFVVVYLTKKWKLYL